MGKKDKQKAAARACAGRATIRTDNTQATASETSMQPGIQVIIKPEVIFVDDESDVDCDYTGGVNYIPCSNEENNVEDAWEISDARMHDGWYFRDGQKIAQPMVFLENHLINANQPKGIKAVLIQRGLYQSRLRGKCESKCDSQKINCCNKRILEYQDDFKEQKSLVQETIEAAGHHCIFLPKFHCELNYIEFF